MAAAAFEGGASWGRGLLALVGLVAMLANMALEGRHTLFVLPADGDVLYKSLRNLNGVRVLRSHELNAYTILWADNLVFTKAALAGAEEVFA